MVAVSRLSCSLCLVINFVLVEERGHRLARARRLNGCGPIAKEHRQESQVLRASFATLSTAGFSFFSSTHLPISPSEDLPKMRRVFIARFT